MLDLFLTQGATGSLAALLLVPARQAGRSFLRYATGQGAALIIMGILAGAGASAAPEGRTALFGSAAALLMLSAGLIHLDRAGAGRAALLAGIACAVIGVARDGLWIARSAPAAVRAPEWLYALDSLTAGLTLGGALAAMVLGHYYLNIPGLSIRHLQRLCLAFLLAVGVRAVVVGCCLAWHAARLRPMVQILLGNEAELTAAGGADPFILVFVIIQVLFGIIGAGVTALMAWRTSLLGATQPTTGILYVSLLMVIMGELASRYLLAITRLPL